MAVLFSYVILWMGLSKANQTGSDFAATYVGSCLIRTGHSGELYNYQAQLVGYHLFVTPNLPIPSYAPPFIDVPLASVVALPFSFLGAATAFSAWGATQLCLLLAACLIALRAAPNRSRRPLMETLAIALIALGSYCTLDLLRGGQWDGLIALGLALAYSSWRRDKYATGAVALIASAMVAKPQLALGLMAFMLGWRNRHILRAALATGVAMSVASLSVIGVSGLPSFIHLLAVNAHVYDPSGQYGFIALPNAWLGDGPLASPIAYLGILGLLALCFIVGDRLRTGRLELGLALTLAACLSLLAAPHSYTYDAVMLTPALIWVLAQYSPFSAVGTVSRCMAIILFLWYATTAVPFLDYVPAPLHRAGNLAVWFLVALALCLWWLAHHTSTPQLPNQIRLSKYAQTKS